MRATGALRSTAPRTLAAATRTLAASAMGAAMSEKRRSGTPTTPNAKRTKPMVTITLSTEALARLDAIASERGQSRSGAVEALVRNARLRESDSR